MVEYYIASSDILPKIVARLKAVVIEAVVF